MIHDLAGGGAEKVLVNLVNNMDSNKFDITVMTLFSGGVNEQFLKSHIKLTSCFHKTFPANSYIFKLFSPERLYKKFIKKKYDMIISYLEGPTARIVSGCTNLNESLLAGFMLSSIQKLSCHHRSEVFQRRKNVITSMI